MNRIETIESFAVRVALEQPVLSAVRRAEHMVAVLVRVRATDGEGVGFVSAFTPTGARAIRALVDGLGEALTGHDATDPVALHAKMSEQLRLIGTGGPSASAIAAVDIALWDLCGTVRQLPVHRLIGSRHQELEVYSSDGCWLSPPDQVVEEAQIAASRGFRTLKVRVGRPDLAVDIHTLDRVREALGSDIRIIVDANQAWDNETVEKAAPELLRIGIDWLEEPLPAYDFEGYGALSHLGLRIAAGESFFDLRHMERLVAGGAIEVLAPDLQRVAGITGWLRAAERTQAHVDLVASHLYPEFSTHLLATQLKPGPVESVGWALPFASPSTQPHEGRLPVPDAPGFGVTYDLDAVSRFAMGGQG